MGEAETEPEGSWCPLQSQEPARGGTGRRGTCGKEGDGRVGQAVIEGPAGQSLAYSGSVTFKGDPGWIGSNGCHWNSASFFLLDCAKLQKGARDGLQMLWFYSLWLTCFKISNLWSQLTLFNPLSPPKGETPMGM